MSITIIGCGWLGVALGRELVKQNQAVHGSVRKEAGFDTLVNAGINPFQLDLEETTIVPEELVNSTKTLVITLPPIDRKNPEHYQTILRNLLKQFSDDTRVIFTSSTGIYPKDANNYKENYAFSKEQESTVLHVAEEVIRQSSKSHVIFRLGGLIGPNRHPICFLQGRKGVKNPSGPINFVHQGDCIRALLLSIRNTEVTGTFNLVFPDHPTRQDYYSKAAEFYELVAPSFTEEEATQRLISSERIMNELQFEFEFPIDNFPKVEFT